MITGVRCLTLCEAARDVLLRVQTKDAPEADINAAIQREKAQFRFHFRHFPNYEAQRRFGSGSGPGRPIGLFGGRSWVGSWTSGG